VWGPPASRAVDRTGNGPEPEPKVEVLLQDGGAIVESPRPHVRPKGECMPRYERPTVLASYTVDELRADAAACMSYTVGTVSDRTLKTHIETVAGSLGQLTEL
jgi:hypothetical protein